MEQNMHRKCPGTIHFENGRSRTLSIYINKECFVSFWNSACSAMTFTCLTCIERMFDISSNSSSRETESECTTGFHFHYYQQNKLHKTGIKGVCNIHGVISISSFIISEFLLYYYCYWGSENPVIEPLPTYVRRCRRRPAACCCRRNKCTHVLHKKITIKCDGLWKYEMNEYPFLRLSSFIFLCAGTFWSPTTSYATVRAAVAFWRALHFSLPLYFFSPVVKSGLHDVDWGCYEKRKNYPGNKKKKPLLLLLFDLQQ